MYHMHISGIEPSSVIPRRELLKIEMQCQILPEHAEVKREGFINQKNSI